MKQVTISIIAVDDNKSDLALLSDALQEAGIDNFKLFSFAEPFLVEVKSEECAVVIIDHLLEQQQGFDIMKQVQQVAPKTYIIILSGYGDVYEFVNYANGGAHKFVLKGENNYLQKLIGFVKEGVEFQRKLLALKEHIQEL